METVSLLGPDGRLVDRPDLGLEVTPLLCRDLYRHMRLARRLDEEATALQRQGELGLWLQSLGQEAAQVGSITAVRPQDHVFPSYREHAAALCRGISPSELLLQWRGAAHSGWDPDAYRFHVYTLVLAAQLPHATGYAMGVQRDGADEIVLAYVGDGATSEGDANETLNWACAAEVPLLVVCQNNQWAISTPTHVQMRSPLHQRARGFGWESHLVDGNDVLAVHAITRAAAERIRDGGGPEFIEAVTYRMAGHSTSDDPSRYRTQGELDVWQARDPIMRLEKLLREREWADASFHHEVERDCRLLAEQTRTACRGIPDPPPEAVFDHVLAAETPLLARQRRHYLDLVASYED